MIYPLDFRLRTEKRNPDNKFTISVLSENFVVKKNGKGSSLDKFKQRQEHGILNRYCNNSTIHGLRYFTEPNVQTSER